MRPSRGHVLAVDDDPAILDVLVEFLQSRGYTVDAVGDGPGALAHAQHQPPDVILLDLRMPGMSGVDILTRLRELRPDVPIVLLTGSADTTETQTALRMGAYAHVSKPFDFRQLQDVIEAALRGTGRSS